jgi:hypothetical protein
VIVLAVSLALGVKLYRQYGDPAYTAQVIRYTQITDTSLVLDFTVRVPAGGSTVCLLRARDYGGAEVGQREATVTAAPGAEQVTASEPVPTTARPFIGEVVRCRPPG